MKPYEEIRPAQSITLAQEKLIDLNYVFTPYFENDGGDLIKIGELWTPIILQGRCDDPVQIKIAIRSGGVEVSLMNLDSFLRESKITGDILFALAQRCQELIDETYGDGKYEL